MKPDEEKKIMQFWQKNNIYKKAKDLRIKAKKFYFLDGPPYASGNIHMGTAWNKILKDAIEELRSKLYFEYDKNGLLIQKEIKFDLSMENQ